MKGWEKTNKNKSRREFHSHAQGKNKGKYEEKYMNLIQKHLFIIKFIYMYIYNIYLQIDRQIGFYILFIIF